jgi:hypothetical protein
MKIAFIAAVMLALASSSAPAAEPQASRCLAYPPFCPYGQSPLCVCDNDFSYNCIWMCASTR